jgi:hypothetical protein
MRLENIAGLAFDHIFGRILRRALLALFIAAAAVVALYYFTAAGSLSLEMHFGALHALLIVGAVYGAAAVMAYAVWWTMRRKTASANAPVLSGQRDMQIAMLVEAVMLGYALARKGDRAR